MVDTFLREEDKTSSLISFANKKETNGKCPLKISCKLKGNKNLQIERKRKRHFPAISCKLKGNEYNTIKKLQIERKPNPKKLQFEKKRTKHRSIFLAN